jgi:hypothetical protein
MDRTSRSWSAVAAGVGLLLAAATSACGGGGSGGAGVVPRGARSFGLAVGAAEDGDYDGAFGKARALGMDVTSLSLGWDEIETSPGVFTDPFLAIAESYYPPSGTGVVLAILPHRHQRPARAGRPAGLAFDDPAVIARFDAIDWVFTQIPTLELPALSIGNEVDAYLGTDATAWAQYHAFFTAVRAHIASVRPGLNVGVKATFRGLTGAAKTFLADLDADADSIFATYYPLATDFTVLATTVVRADLDALCALFPGRAMISSEFGAPSSALLISSERWALFVHALFDAWDAHAVNPARLLRLADRRLARPYGFKLYGTATELPRLPRDAGVADLPAAGPTSSGGRARDGLRSGGGENRAPAGQRGRPLRATRDPETTQRHARVGRTGAAAIGSPGQRSCARPPRPDLRGQLRTHADAAHGTDQPSRSMRPVPNTAISPPVPCSAKSSERRLKSGEPGASARTVSTTTSARPPRRRRRRSRATRRAGSPSARTTAAPFGAPSTRDATASGRARPSAARNFSTSHSSMKPAWRRSSRRGPPARARAAPRGETRLGDDAQLRAIDTDVEDAAPGTRTTFGSRPWRARFPRRRRQLDVVAAEHQRMRAAERSGRA